jgi:tape measure domain-containing protein
MATLRELLVTIETKLNEPAMKEAQRRIDNELSKAEKKFNRVYKQVLKEQAVALKEMQDKQRRAMQSMNDTANKLGGVLAGVFIGLAVAIPTATYAMLKLNSELNAMIARIGVFTGNLARARDTLKELVDISLDTGVALGAVEDIFGKISMNAKALDADGQEVIEVTRGVAQAIAISGKPISEMSGALTQLGQAFASPIVQAEEFRSVFEGANFFANEIAKSILGSNGTAGALFQLVKKQKLTNKMLFIAIKDALPRILKQFGQMPLSLDRVINRFQLMGFRVAMAMEEFQKLEGPQKFLKVLDNLIEKTTNYLINNQALISSKMTEFFNNATNAVNALVFTYKLLEPYLPLLINGFIGITTALTALVVVTKAIALYQAIANAVMLASPTTWMIVGISALIGILAVLVMNWKSVTSAIQTAYAWLSKMASLVASFSMDKIGQLITLVGGGVKPPAKVKPAMAQRQGAGTTNTSTRNLQQNVVVNASGGITPQKAKSIGSSLANNARRGLVSAGVY